MTMGFRGRDLYFKETFDYPTGFTAATFGQTPGQIDPVTGLPLLPLGPANGNSGPSNCPDPTVAPV